MENSKIWQRLTGWPGIVAFSVLAALPIWIVEYPPLVDYPNHLARAFVLYHLNDPTYQFGNWYAAGWAPNPYLFVDSLMQLFQGFFGIYIAGKIMLTLCVIALPAATLFFLRRANPGNEYLALWSLVVAYNTNMLMGFMSFELSIALCFVLAGLWIDYLRIRREWIWVLLLGLTTLLYFTHLGGFGMAGVILTIYTLYACRSLKMIVRAWILFLPGVSLFLYAKLHSWSGRGLDYSTWHIASKLRTMATGLRGYSAPLDVLTLLVFAGSVAYIFAKKEKLRLNRIWIVITGAILVIHWMVPNRYGDLGFIDYRFPVFAFLTALAIPSFAGSRKLLTIAALSIFLLRTFDVGADFISKQKYLKTLAFNSTEVPRNSKVFACTADNPSVKWVDRGDYEFWAYGIIDRGWISPSLFHQVGVQPLQLKAPMIAGDDENGIGFLQGKYDLNQMRETYDYLWAYNVGSSSQNISLLGSVLISTGNVEIVRVKAQQSQSSTPAQFSDSR